MQPWFETVLGFANAKNVAASVGQLKGSLCVVSDVEHKRWMIQFPVAPSVSEGKEAQAELRKVLARIVRDGGANRQTWDLIVAATKIELPRVSGWLDFQPANQKTYFALTSIEGRKVAQWWGYHLAELVMQGLDERVRQCALETCNNYFVDAKTRGPSRLFCSTNHASQARVKRKRERDKRR